MHYRHTEQMGEGRETNNVFSEKWSYLVVKEASVTGAATHSLAHITYLSTRYIGR